MMQAYLLGMPPLVCFKLMTTQVTDEYMVKHQTRQIRGQGLDHVIQYHKLPRALREWSSILSYFLSCA
jgi:hypothetical protein